MKKQLLLFILSVFILPGFLHVSCHGQAVSSEKTIVVVGSSVASGWVSSYKEKYDMQNGYLTRLSRKMEPEGWTIINKSVPGFDTKASIKLLQEELVALDPDFIYIGLSMSNEGLETEDPDSVSESYEKGLRKLIELCENENIRPVVGLCYPNDNYTPLQYEYLKKMNLKISEWGVPCINLLGALDNGEGHFPQGVTFDPNHPGNLGHEEFYYSIPIDLFDALSLGKKVNMSLPDGDGLKLGKKAGYNQLSYVPGSLIHSFSQAFSFKTSRKDKLAEILSNAGSHLITLDSDKRLVYQSPNGSIRSIEKCKGREWQQIVITHSYLNSKTSLYLDGELQGILSEQCEPHEFILGNGVKEAGYKNLLLYRAALNHDEVSELFKGKVLPGSLEIASALNDDGLEKNVALSNMALSLSQAILDPAGADKRRSDLKREINMASIARDNELKVDYKQPIKLDPAVYDLYTGKYEIAPGDYFEVIRKEDRLFFADRGNEAELLPESRNKFFIRYPADLTITFSIKDGLVSGLVFSVNGREMKAKKAD